MSVWQGSVSVLGVSADVPATVHTTCYLGLALAVMLIVAFPRASLAGRMGSWDDKAQKFLPAIAEPDKSSSYLALEGGDQLHDFLLAQTLFVDKNTMIAKYGALLFGIDSCASGGFIGDLAATDGKESSLADPKLVRPNIGVMTATSYNKCSIFGGSGKNAFSAFSKGFNVAVGPPHPDSDAWLGAYKTAAKAVQQGQILAGGTLDSQAPQYWSTGDRIDSLTPRPGQQSKDFAFLVVSPGKDDAEAFWNDLFDLHQILVADYGWSDDPGSKHEIIVLYANGVQPAFVKEKIGWIDGSATSVSLEKQLTRVHSDFTDSSLGFFYFASHGATVEVPEPISIELFGASLLILAAYWPWGHRKSLKAGPKDTSGQRSPKSG